MCISVCEVNGITDFKGILCFCTVHCNIIVQYKPTKCTFFQLICYIFTMPSTCFEPESSSSGRRLYVQYDLMWFWPVSSLICGNKMPTRYNRGFYCRYYCLFNMFRAPLCPSSGAQKYYTVVAACGISCCGFQVVGLAWSWGLCVRSARCCSIL